MTLPFIKMHGLGNDYVYVDGFSPETAALLAGADLSALAIRVSDRHRGIGSDGLVLILPDANNDARMRIFNADGSEAEMCGNAIRCVGKYLYESGRCSRPRIFIATRAGVRTLVLLVKKGVVEQVTVNMGVPVIRPDALEMNSDPHGFMSVNMGNPHAVFFRDSAAALDELHLQGESISTHPYFSEGTNVEFVRVRNPKELDVRVWERGSGETLACGTGACAAAVAAIRNGWTGREVTVHLPGGDLEINWPSDLQPVYLTGPATLVYRGEIEL